MYKVEFQIIPSTLLQYYLYGIYILAAITLIFLSTTLYLKIIFILCLAGFWYQDKRRYQKNGKPIKLWHEESNIFTIETTSGQRIKGQLKGDSFKCPWFIILRLKTMPSKRITTPTLARSTRSLTLFIARDSLSDFEYRILSCRLLNF